MRNPEEPTLVLKFDYNLTLDQVRQRDVAQLWKDAEEQLEEFLSKNEYSFAMPFDMYMDSASRSLKMHMYGVKRKI